ncbi:peptidoglycan editing factor PgeF [Kribbella deserti]|uniref:Purine nucleoside phosphorylase n=1 Tax=Kribbella deserti TaxID=1926257 RepID=A0ABV6QI49_9ACTN
MFGYDEVIEDVRFAFTDRYGGVSQPPYAELNLGSASGDDVQAVAENVRRVAHAFGVGHGALIRVSQVHGADVHHVDAEADLTFGSPMATADAMVTTRTDVALCIRVADCVPILLADPVNRVAAAVHAGRPGMFAGVVPAAVDAMRELGAQDILAIVGPHVCGRCYEVPVELRDEVAAKVPAAYAETSWGTPALDVGAGVTGQLADAGCRIIDAARCTIESDDLFSYRREGKASGRLAGVVRLLP